jgi:hypothetical protein
MRDASRSQNVSTWTIVAKAKIVRSCTSFRQFMGCFWTYFIHTIYLIRVEDSSIRGIQAALYEVDKKGNYMKLVNTLSILGTFLLATACGSSQAPVAAFNSIGSGVGTGTGSGNNIGGQPVYDSSGAIVGYKASTVILGGYQQVVGNQVTFSSQVNAGDQLVVNLTGIQYIATTVRCTGALGLVESSSSGFGSAQLMNNGSLTLNGQSVTSSSTLAAGGTLQFSATLGSTGYTCIGNSSAATDLAYLVNFASAITRTYCVNTSGTAMACP